MRHRSTSADPLSDFWVSTRLRAGAAVSGTAAPRPAMPRSFKERLAAALSAAYREGPAPHRGHDSPGARTTPSAGALYPFDVLVCLPRDSAPVWDLYWYDVGRAALVALAAAPPRRPSPAPWAEAAALVVLAARPWRSMAKYGPRGYLYACLDTGHATAAIGLSAEAAGLAPTTHLRFDRRTLAALLGLDELCSEPQAVITVARTGAASAPYPFVPAPPGAPVWLEGARGGLPLPGAAEQANWQQLERGTGRPTTGTVPPARPVRTASMRPAAVGIRVRLYRERRPADPGELARTAERRSSARGFTTGRLALVEIGQVLSALHGGTVVDGTPAPSVLPGVRLFSRAVWGLPGGAYAFDPDTHTLDFRGSAPDDEQTAATAYLGQHSTRAAALLVLHAPVGAALRTLGRQGLAEIHFHAAHLAYRLSLGATRYGVGLTCVGGFDDAACTTLFRLEPADGDVVHALALGVADVSAVKRDRKDVPYDSSAAAGSSEEAAC
ncbi:nitroreductase family protein [Streptomyces sp. NPDC026589]|uniref:nitroreductase family protein n=1 Tax=Streptomyces sp. NPDC026589 TaxID=3155609 RepID=UPI0033F1F29D